jgi:cyclopropane fatty-acyl-phospholipid synthase-like methyltransferase
VSFLLRRPGGHNSVRRPSAGAIPVQKPYSQACENNKEPILNVLRSAFEGIGQVLEIGAGTGQHAVHFARHLPQLIWHPTDLPEHLAGIRLWIDGAGLPNLAPPRPLDVNDARWVEGPIEGIFSANTTHILAWESVEAMFRGIGRHLAAGGRLCLYGPFNYGGCFTSDSNARFDEWLRLQDPASGIRDFEAIDRLARDTGLELLADHAMPANNRTLVWRKPRPATHRETPASP